MHRSTVFRVLPILALLVAALAVGQHSAQADHMEGPDRVYFSQTEQYLSGAFLDYWRHNGDIPIFGYPITGEIEEDGTTVQYFERAVFEWHPEAEEGWKVQLRLLGVQMVEDMLDGRDITYTELDELDEGNDQGDGTSSQSNLQPFQPATEADGEEDCTFYEATSHNLCAGFQDYWEDNGGLPVFGYPISEEFVEDGLTVQYFERARFEWHPDESESSTGVLLGHLGTRAAEESGVDRSPVPQNPDVPSYDPALWSVPEPAYEGPQVVTPAGAPTGQAKWIEVDLSAQYFQAWEYDQVVYSGWVSTGKAGYRTPTGYFNVFYKLRYDDMTNGRAAPPSEYYYTEDVPWVMYFLEGGYAIHGAYWHNDFGIARSHGCVNLTVPDAAWVYQWAPYGTTVWVHE